MADTTGGSLLPSFTDRLLDRLKERGLVPMTLGVTKPLPPTDSYDAAMFLAQNAIDTATAQFGARAPDRYSQTIGDSYRDRRYEFITKLEGVATKAYTDKGSPTIGAGFRMDKENAREVWKQAFGDSVSFDAVYAGKTTITPAQARTLFDYDTKYYEGLVDKALQGRPVSQNQRLALFSVAYNAPAQFWAMKDDIRAGNDAKVADRILTDSFAPGSGDELKSRRYLEATMWTSPGDAENVMPTYEVYHASVEVDKKTGVTSLRAVGTADISGMGPEFQKRLANLIDNAPDNIKSGLGVYSGYRSVEKQTKLFNDAVQKYGSVAAARKWVAPPGHSQHNFGHAADVSYNGKSLKYAPPEVIKYMHDNAEKYGLRFPLANEVWHIEPIEARKTGTLFNWDNLQPINGNSSAPQPHSRPITPDAPQPLQRPAALGGPAPGSTPPASATAKKTNAMFDAVPPAAETAKKANAMFGPVGPGVYGIKTDPKNPGLNIVDPVVGKGTVFDAQNDPSAPVSAGFKPGTWATAGKDAAVKAPPGTPAWVTAARARAMFNREDPSGFHYGQDTTQIGVKPVPATLVPKSQPVTPSAPVPMNRPSGGGGGGSSSPAPAAQVVKGSSGRNSYEVGKVYSRTDSDGRVWSGTFDSDGKFHSL